MLYGAFIAKPPFFPAPDASFWFHFLISPSVGFVGGVRFWFLARILSCLKWVLTCPHLSKYGFFMLVSWYIYVNLRERHNIFSRIFACSMRFLAIPEMGSPGCTISSQ